VISSADTDIAYDIDTHNRDKTEPNETVFMANLPERRNDSAALKTSSEHPATPVLAQACIFIVTERVGRTLQEPSVIRQCTNNHYRHDLRLCVKSPYTITPLERSLPAKNDDAVHLMHRSA
jgi:hypothetical protein